MKIIRGRDLSDTRCLWVLVYIFVFRHRLWKKMMNRIREDE